MTIVFAADEQGIRSAAEMLLRGGLVAFPTETVYGLGADGFNASAAARIFAAKGRPQDNPLILHIASQEQLESVAKEIPDYARKLIKEFWPGPLALVLPARSQVPSSVRAGLPTVAVRMPDHDVALRLIQAVGRPLAAPSANLSGRPSPTTAQHVLSDLEGKIDAVLDGGPSQAGIESTVLDCAREIPCLLRPGMILREDIERVLGGPLPRCEDLQPDRDQALPAASPGMKYRHYAPQADLQWIEEDRLPLLKQAAATGSGRQVYLSHGFAGRAVEDAMRELARRFPEKLQILELGNELSEMASRLFQSLREADRLGASRIWIARLPARGLGLVITDRLQKAME